MHRPGTVTILRMLTQSADAPPYARQYRHFQHEQRRASVILRALAVQLLPPRLVAFTFRWIVLGLGCCLVCTLLAAVSTWLLWAKTIWANPEVLLWGALGIAVLGSGAGAAMLAGTISQAITLERQRHTWANMLMLPHPRHQVVLYGIAPAYMPYPFGLSLSLGVLVAIDQAPALDAVLLVVCGLLLIEWLQLAALLVAAGITFGSLDSLNASGPILFGLALMLLRAGAGWVLAQLSGAPLGERYGALLIGPLGRLLSPDAWLIGLPLVALYLLGLEIAVRAVFAWGIVRTGEG